MRGVIVLLTLLFAALFAGVAVSWQQQAADQALWQQEGVMWFPQPLPVGEFEFVTQNGDRVSHQDLTDRWKLIFFGYTFCPDICPTTLADLSRSWKKLAPEVQEKLQVVLVSVDPQRDTAASLKPYMDYFNPAFLAFTGSPQSLAAITPQLHAFYARVERDDGMAYLMDHTANIALVSPDWQYHGYIAPPHWPKRMVPLLESLAKK
jgi:protein SCO1/2